MGGGGRTIRGNGPPWLGSNQWICHRPFPLIIVMRCEERTLCLRTIGIAPSLAKTSIKSRFAKGES
jgi:hypothetical protein